MRKSPAQANFWLCEGATCVNNGEGSLTIAEVGWNVYDEDSPLDSDSDPEGLGAYMFEISFNHNVVDLAIQEGPFLGSTGRATYPMIEFITDDWIRFGCVSTGDQIGPMGPGPATLAYISMAPTAELVESIRPSRGNGIVTTLSDGNCQWADIHGFPMLGTGEGVLVPVCDDATITVRALEGDLNLDCVVNTLDEQTIAFRNGASCGSLLYDVWYDLDPAEPDCKIDTQDVEFVSDRKGTTCQAPIPSPTATSTATPSETYTPTATQTPTPTPRPVGGIVGLPSLPEPPAAGSDAPADGSGWSAGGYVALAGLGAAAAAAVGAGGWYARRRWLR